MAERTPLLLALAVLTAACASTPDESPPVQDLPVIAAAAPAPDLGSWWKSFGDPALDALVAKALEHNHDLQIAAARVAEVGALLRNADDLLPLVNARAGVGRSQTSDRAAFPRFGGIDRRNYSWTVGLDVTYEIDLWGRVRAGERAARADLAAVSADACTAASALAANTAAAYWRLVAIDRRIALFEATVQNRAEAARVQAQRLQGGTGTRLELQQAEAERCAAESPLPAQRSARAAAERALLVLTGATPRELAESTVARTSTLVAPPAVPASLTSDLLQRRPDVRSAEAALAAATARVDEARARYFPTIRLTGTLGQESKDLSDLFVGPATVWNLASGLTQPLFGLRKIDAQVDAATARRQAAEENYAATAQHAYAEALDALTASGAAAETLRATERQLQAVSAVERTAAARHAAGVGTFLELLDAQRGRQQVESAHIDAELGRLLAAVDVCRALGGGFGAAGR